VTETTRWGSRAAALYTEAYADKYRAADDEIRDGELVARFSGWIGRVCDDFDSPIDVLDMGCGTGRYFQALRRVKSLAGIDVSRPMLELAARRGAAVPQLSFRQGDASVVALPANHDLIFSRFGIMFFDDPAAAFVNLKSWLAPGGRLAFCCWRSARDNPWATIGAIAVREALGLEAPAFDPYAPGPFAFAEIDRLRGLIQAAGFDAFNAIAFDSAIAMGASTQEAAEMMTRTGPASRIIREAGEHTRPDAVAAIEKALEPLAAADGSVALMGAIWVVSASVA
jgi:SAM-dependent methyltransferase